MQKKKLTVRSMTYMALYVALYLVLKFVGNMIPFLRMPNGGSIELELTALFVCSYQMGWKYGIAAALLSWIVSIFSGFGLYIVHPVQILLDYIVPLAVCGGASLFCPDRKDKKGRAMLWNIILTLAAFLTIVFGYGRGKGTYMAAVIVSIILFGLLYVYGGKKNPYGIMIAMVLKYLSQVLSGVYFWFPEGSAAGSAAAWTFSLSYNLWYNVVTMVICVILVPLLVETLRKANIGKA